MSAVDEYKDSMLGPNPFCHRRLVDAAIAELEAALAERTQERNDWKALYSIRVRPRCGSDMAYNAQVAFDMGCVGTDRAIATDRARASKTDKE